MKKRREQQVFIAAFLAPALILYTLFVALPSVKALAYSLHRWDGLSAPVWTGLKNFIDMAHDSEAFLAALGHNVFLMTASGTLIMVLSLFFAAALHRRIRGANLFRVAFFFPNIISSVAIALLWMLLYSTTDFGVINGFLVWMEETLGWSPLHTPFPFLGKPYLIYAAVPIMVWTATGFYMVLFLAGMESIPETFYEAATLDGASSVAQFFYITLPLVREVLTVGLVFLVIGSLKAFDIIWVLDNGWPTTDTHVLATLLYQKVFNEYNVGYGSAIAVVLFLLVFAATLITLRLSRKEAMEY